MGDFEEHFGDHDLFYPATSLVVGLFVYGVTGDGLVMLATVVVGYAVLGLGLLVPDVDSTQSIIRRTLDRAVLWALVAALVGWLVASDVGAAVGLAVGFDAAALAGVSDWFVLVALAALALYWWGATTTHRGLPHEPEWGAAMAALLVAAVWFAFPGWESLSRLAVGGGLAVHFLVGFLAHLDRDGVLFGEDASFEADPELDPELDPDPDPEEGDAHGE